MECEYKFDAANRVLTVSDNWDYIAAHNEAPDLTQNRVLGLELNTLLYDDSTRALYDAIFRKVRADQRELAFEYQCDTPSERRRWLMRVSADSSATVCLSNSLLQSTPRTPVELLQSQSSKTDDFVIMCSWCMRLKTGIDALQEIESGIEALELFKRPVNPRVSYSICSGCMKEVLSKLGE